MNLDTFFSSGFQQVSIWNDMRRKKTEHNDNTIFCTYTEMNSWKPTNGDFKNNLKAIEALIKKNELNTERKYNIFMC